MSVSAPAQDHDRKRGTADEADPQREAPSRICQGAASATAGRSTRPRHRSRASGCPPCQPFPSPPSAAQPDVERARLRSPGRSEEHTSELQSHLNLVCRLLLEKKKRCHYRLCRTSSPPGRTTP